MSENKGIMVHAEVIEGRLSGMATELLGCGRALANELGQELSAVLVGSEVSGLAQDAIAAGADKVYVVDVNPRITTSLVGIATCMKEEIAGILVDASKGGGPEQVNLTGSVRFDTHGKVTPV